MKTTTYITITLLALTLSLVGCGSSDDPHPGEGGTGGVAAGGSAGAMPTGGAGGHGGEPTGGTSAGGDGGSAGHGGEAGQGGFAGGVNWDYEVCESTESCSQLGQCAYDPAAGCSCDIDTPYDPDCRIGGQPVAPWDCCVADSDDDCKASGDCINIGTCSWSLGWDRCYAASNEDCAQSDGCLQFGFCTACPNGYCQAAC